jgi:ATP-dependent Lon protease
MEEVLKHALSRQPQPIVWEEDVKGVTAALAKDDDVSGVVAH